MLENHINSLLSHPFLITLPPLFLLLFLIKCLSSSAAAGGRRPPPSPPFKLPVIGHLHKLGTYPHRSLRAMSRQHGPLMSLRLGSVPAVVASSAAAAREILKTHDLTFASRPKLEINRKLLYNYKDVVTAPYGEFWRQMKSVMVVHLLSNKRVESIRAIREQETEQFASKIAESSGSAVDLSELFMSLTNDVVSRAAVGRKYNDGESGKKFRKLMRELMGLLGGFDIGAFIPSLSWVNRLNGLDAAVERVAAEIDEFLEGVVEERLRLREKKDEEREDFMDVLLGIYEDKNLIKLSIDRESVKALILDIFSGGTDTTYTVLEWAMTELLRNPRTMKKLQNEVRNTVRDKPNIIDEDLEKLPYLKAVIKETLRLHPPIPLLIPREASHDVKVMGYDITKGTMIIINAWAIGMDPSSWDEPDEFKPERFLNSPIDIRGHDFDVFTLNGSVTAEGGDGGYNGGGGSGGSIILHAYKLKGCGTISAAGGRGKGGGGGGRISMKCYSKQEDIKVTVHGGLSIGCHSNAGAAGTYFDASVLSLRVGNDNVTTETETPLLDFSTSPLWSNVYVENNAKVLVPLIWTRVQVRGQISLLCGGTIIFGLAAYPISEFELVAEELLMSDSTIKVYGALRVAVKVLLMWNSRIDVDGDGNTGVTTSVLEVRNLVVLRENSVISSNMNLALYGQGLLKLTGQGDAIKGQRLSLSLFYNITVGPGSLLQAPLDDDVSRSMVTKSLCESPACPMDLITPPDDCHVNYTLSFSLQICRVEDILVNGIIKGSVIHIHRARTVIVDFDGMITASELGCGKGIGKGKYSNGAGGGAGHGGRGGSGLYNGRVSEGGNKYGSASLPCELGSGTEGPNESYGHVTGGGMIVMGSNQWPLSRLDIYGSTRADGQSYGQATRNGNGTLIGGLGGASGGTILLFLQTLALEENSSLSVVGGFGGSLGGGGGGGGRIHFHWSKINVEDQYVPLAVVNGTVDSSGGAGNGDGLHGEEGTVTGKKCPKGLYGTFCTECPVGTYKDVEGSDPYLCTPCSLELLPGRANFIYVRGGVTHSSCPYKCMSDKYRMPKCYTAVEELMYTFGGPLPFSLLLSCIVVLLALLLSTLRIKLVGGYSYRTADTIEPHSHHHFPYLLSLSEVRGTRAEDIQSHVHRMYFMGPNTFREPWHLPYSPPNAIIEIVYEDSFNRFIDEINSVAAYDWWEGSVHSIFSVLAYPCAWSWKQWRRRNKIHRLQEYVKSEYDHSCLRSCRSRALYKGMKVGATPDLMVAYIDFFLGGDEKRLDIVTSIQKRFPMCILFGGDGSYMSPYNLHGDTLLTNLLAQHVPTTVWNRLVAGLNAQLRTVRHRSIRSALIPVINWIRSHGNPQLEFHGVKIELGWFQATASGYYQLGILVVVGDYSPHDLDQSAFLKTNEEYLRNTETASRKSLKQIQQSESYINHALSRKWITGGVNGGLINDATLKSLDFKRDFFFPLSMLLHNTRPVGRQDTIQLLITIMLLADLSVTLLMLLLFYWIAIGAFLAVLLVLPLSLLSPFPAGLNALFTKGPRRALLARVYALWNATSLSNIAVAFICGIIHYGFLYFQPPKEPSMWNFGREDDQWWLLPTILLLFKLVQARFVDWHIANIEVQDFSLFSPDPDTFWAYESTS